MGRLRNLCVSTVVAALVAATPAMAQRLSLAERVTRLENQANTASQGTAQSNLDAQNRIVQLQSEVASLRNLVEELQHRISELERTQRQQYLDLDGRLQRLDGAAPSAPRAAADPATAPAAPEPAPPARREEGFTDAEPVDPDTDPALAAATVAADPAAEEAEYQAALDALVERFEAADSARMFRRFIDRHPDSALLPNAWYWLGESYYVTQNFELARDAFATLLRDHAGSRKEADAMLKLGYSEIAMGDAGAGEATLRDLIGRYPGTDAAAKAESRLRTLALENR